MPLLKSTYTPPFYLSGNAHFQTVLPSLFRKVEGVDYQRERVELPDGDFLDIDWHTVQSCKLLIVCHGLEGSADRHYVKGVAKVVAPKGWDVMALNFRSCSGEMNRLPRMYHHGETSDLSFLVQLALGRGYKQLALVGFSLGGSVVLNYLGRSPEKVPAELKTAIAVSVPLDLVECSTILEHRNRWFYRQRFLKKLMKKMEQKQEVLAGKVTFPPTEKVEYFRQFDNLFTAPLHGFANADDYYQKVSSIAVIDQIQVPVLVLNALNDPFLGKRSFPVPLFEKHQHLFLEVPEQGGHVGFQLPNSLATYAEIRIAEWLTEKVK